MTDSSRLALLGGVPVRDEARRPWPKWPISDELERATMLEVLESGAWWYGERVRRFEDRYAAFQGAAHCVSCTSGTTALEIALQDRKSTRLNSSHLTQSRMPSSA